LKKISTILKILIAQTILIVVILAIIEVVGQLHAFYKPAYDTLSTIPDKVVGWRMAPNLEYVHAGHHWYEREFRAEVKVNSLGFRDYDRTPIKPADTIRIVVLGDSFVAAEEVSFKDTPAQVLEQRLNLSIATNQSRKFEALNFGIGGFGIGHSFLTWNEYAKTFDPDYVFLFIFEGDIWRSVSPVSAITNNIIQPHQLNVSPFFALSQSDNNNFRTLLEILNFRSFHQILLDLKAQKLTTGKISPPTEEEYLNLTNSLKSHITEGKIARISENLNQSDLLLYAHKESVFDEFVRLQNKKIKSGMGEDRTQVRKHGIFLLDLWGKIGVGLKMLHQRLRPKIIMEEEFDGLIKTYGPETRDVFSGNENFPNFEKVVFINLKILEQLNENITIGGMKLIVIDASSQIKKQESLPAILFATILEKYCKVNGIGYIPLHQYLKKAKANGIQTSWTTDAHFNENGYRIFGEAMFRWIETHKN
jgi:hypothetical protein